MNSKRTDKIGHICQEWWRETFPPDTGIARATKAHLNRCTTPQEALAIDATHVLIRKLQANSSYSVTNLAEKAGIIATVTASIKNNGDKTLPRLLGQNSENSKTSVMSKMRFERLMKTKEPKELILAMRRSIRFSPGPNVAALSEHLFYWGTDRTFTKWWLDYFGTSEEKTTG